MNDLKGILHGELRAQRAALLSKLEGLSERDARAPRTPTGTNLLGLVKHVAACELGYFGIVFDRPSELPLPWEELDAGPEDNLDMFATENESMAEALAWCRACFEHADATVDALTIESPGRVPHWPPERAEVSLGQILVHLALDEARHAGHADILRELHDGEVGRRRAGENLPEWDDARWAAYRRRLQAIADTYPQ